jgi:hypothetical protein
MACSLPGSAAIAYNHTESDFTVENGTKFDSPEPSQSWFPTQDPFYGVSETGLRRPNLTATHLAASVFVNRNFTDPVHFISAVQSETIRQCNLQHVCDPQWRRRSQGTVDHW